MKRQNSIYGYVWKPAVGMQPVLLSATHRVQLREGLSNLIRNQHWALDYSISDYGAYRVNRATSPWRPRPARVAHLYAPQTPYWEDLRGVAPPIRDAYLTFTGGRESGLNALFRKSSGLVRFLDAEGRLSALIEDAAWIGHTEGQAGFWKAQARLCEVIDLLLRSRRVGEDTYAVEPDAEPNELPLTRAVRDYFLENLASPVSLAALAGRLGVSASTLSHQYRQAVGESPMQTRLRLRIERSKNLLVRGQSLKSVAEATGFCDLYHLSRAFKNFTGQAPRRFVRTLQAGRRGG